MSTASAQLNFFNRAAASSTRLTGLSIDLQKILHRAIFAQSIGRTDLPGGSYIELMQSIHRELIQLPEDYVLYPGHGPAVTVGESLATNPYFEVFRNLFKHRFEE